MRSVSYTHLDVYKRQLPSETSGTGTNKKSVYPGCYVCSKVNEKYVLAYDEALASLFGVKDPNADSSEEENKDKMCIRDRYRGLWLL